MRDLEGNEYATMMTYTIDDEHNGNVTFEAVVEPNKPNLLFLEKITEMWELVDDNETEYKIIYVRKQGQGDLLHAHIRAIPLFFDDFRSQRIYEEYNQSMTAQNAFNTIFNDSGYTFVLKGQFNAVEWEGFGGGETRMEMFQRALNRYKAEFELEGNTIYIDNLVGRDTSIMYRHRLNASNISQEIDASELWTYAKGYADYEDSEDGSWENARLEREYTSPLAQIIGIRHAPPIKDGRIKHKDVLDKQLKELVDESLKISVTADIHDLTKQGYPIAQAKNGDRVFLIDERIGLKEEVRVVNRKITRDWRGRILDINLTFGSQSIVKRHQSDLRNLSSTINDLLEGKIKLPYSVLDNAVIEATKALKEAQTEIIFGDNGLVAIDKNNPNYVVLLNSAGIGVSTDGGNTFRNAITGRGINADVIVTGSMLADRIAGGILRSLNDNTIFNLNTGKLEMQNANFELGGGANIHFTDAGNRVYYSQNQWSAGLGVGRSINNTYPYAFLGTSIGNRPNANDSSDFSGFIANTNAREQIDGIGNSVVGNRFHIRDKAVSFERGYLFKTDDDAYFSPINTGSFDYDLGRPNNRWTNIYGTLAGTSSYNAKMNLEDIDGQQAFDYFMQMVIKSFYYKDDDYTNPYNRKVSPVIEQLDPVLEKLYKTSNYALDINSNLFLLARAFQHFVNETNERLELIENET